MEPRKPAADRIRPILAAMERSIDSARRKRTLDNEPRRQQPTEPAPAATPRGDAPSTNPLASLPNTVSRTPIGDPNDPLRTETGERLKAKPKRPQNFCSHHAQPLPPYHSRAS